MASRILLADDSLTIQKMVRMAFAAQGIEVVVASNGELAIELLGEAEPRLVLASTSLPSINGYDLCEYIKKSPQFSHLPVILLAGPFEAFDQTKAQLSCADARLTKPFELRMLVNVVGRLLRAGGDQARPPAPGTVEVPAEGSAEATSHEASSFNRDQWAQTADADADNKSKREATHADGAPGVKFFRAAVPVGKAIRDVAAEPPADEERALETVTEPPRQAHPPDSAFLVVWAAACVMLIVIGLVAWQGARFGQQMSEDNLQQKAPDQPEQQQAAADSQPPSEENQPAEEKNPAVDDADARLGDGQSATESGPALDPSPPTGSPTRSVRARSPLTQSPAVRARERARLLARARLLEGREMFDQAEQIYRAVLGNFPGDAEGRAGLARLAALRAAKRRVDSNKQGQSAFARRVAGLNEFRQGNFRLAATDLDAAVRAGRTDTAVLYALGASNLKLGRFAEAQSAFESCLASSPNYAPALVGLAEVKAAAGRNDQAVSLLKRALELGGGAEFSPERIQEMISRYNVPPASGASRP